MNKEIREFWENLGYYIRYKYFGDTEYFEVEKPRQYNNTINHNNIIAIFKNKEKGFYLRGTYPENKYSEEEMLKIIKLAVFI